MPSTIIAVYESGVLKPLQTLNLKEHEQVRVILDTDEEWRQEFRNLLNRIHRRTTKYSSQEIEKDITIASQETRRSHHATNSPARH